MFSRDENIEIEIFNERFLRYYEQNIDIAKKGVLLKSSITFNYFFAGKNSMQFATMTGWGSEGSSLKKSSIQV